MPAVERVRRKEVVVRYPAHELHKRFVIGALVGAAVASCGWWALVQATLGGN